MTTFRITQYIVTVDPNGDFASGQVNRVQLAPDGTPFPADPISFEEADLGGLLEEFNAAVLRENSTLNAQLTHVTVTNSTTIEQLQSQITSLTAAHATTVTDLQNQVATAQAEAEANAEAAQLTASLQTQVAALQTDVAALSARVASLSAIAPFDPRRITVAAFLHRLTQAELLMLFSDADSVVQSIGAMLKEWSQNAWPIDFDSKEFVQAMGYLVQVSKLSEERVAAITVDATREESPA